MSLTDDQGRVEETGFTSEPNGRQKVKYEERPDVATPTRVL